MSSLDNDNNTIAHLAAEGGHVAIFKVPSSSAYPSQSVACAMFMHYAAVSCSACLHVLQESAKNWLTIKDL